MDDIVIVGGVSIISVVLIGIMLEVMCASIRIRELKDELRKLRIEMKRGEKR